MVCIICGRWEQRNEYVCGLPDGGRSGLGCIVGLRCVLVLLMY